MNRFLVRCPGCDGLYQHLVVDGFSKLVHPGVVWGAVKVVLPTVKCIFSIDYVYFTTCRHCCPERFAECPDCQHPEIGHPTQKPCRSAE